MILDSLLRLSDGQDLSQAAGSYYSASVLNTATANYDIGAGEALAAIICVDEAFTSGGSATVVFAVIDEADTTLDSDSIVIVETAAIAIASLTLGKIIIIPIPVGLVTQQYLGLKYTIGTATTTAGTVTAFIAPVTFAQTWGVA